MLKCRETFEQFLAACKSSKNTGLPQFFFEVFWQMYFKNINFLTKTKRYLLCWLLWIQNYQINWQFWESKSHFPKSKSNKISSTYIYIGEDLEFIIHVFYWCIPLDHEIYTKCNKKHLTWLKLYLVTISALELKKSTSKKNHLSLTVPKPIDFSQNSSVPFSSSHFRPSNFMCAFNRKNKWKVQKLQKVWKCLIHHKKSF